MPLNLSHATRRWVCPCAARALVASALVFVTVTSVGCANKAPQAPAVTARQVGDFNPPLVVSSQPQQDTAAFAAADEKLSETDWEQLEKLGPRPIWEQIEAKQHQCHKSHRNAVATTQAA